MSKVKRSMLEYPRSVDLPSLSCATKEYHKCRNCLSSPITLSDQYRAVFELNVVSVLNAMQAVIPIMRAQGGGVIINIRSGLSRQIVPGITATDFARNAVRMTSTQTERHRTLPADPPEHVAEKILEAVETEAAEVYGDSIRPPA